MEVEWYAGLPTDYMPGMLRCLGVLWIHAYLIGRAVLMTVPVLSIAHYQQARQAMEWCMRVYCNNVWVGR